MNWSKKMITCGAFVVAFFCVSSAQAQMDTATMRQRQEQRMEKMKTDLNLTAVQMDTLRAVQRDYMPQMREIMMDQSASQEDRRAKMAPIREAMNKRLEAAWGGDLYKKYQDWMAANRPGRG
ncbi:MAG: hypothetical protein Q8927_21210 [Bacteroidota bacterium]|nr:hypothetical protein [Bacteroidota bacterium]MDP4218723.1 hypothetical protein [Bacteroidota bacterium]MDP4245845.1 hypothetical protein [Bacteroidota bacterium]MDP4255246.1 hypothetical protein [Bacteroidota bacterium]MDP4257391.1 hypothetical protein [Bacteroidota bacterium]